MVSNDANSKSGGVVAELAVRAELERRFTRNGRRRVSRSVIAAVAVIVPLIAGFETYLQVQFGTLAWWSAPPHISYCGWIYTPVFGRDTRPDALGLSARPGTDSVASRASLGKLVEVMSLPPLARPVFAAPDAFPDGIGKCADPIFYQAGSGELVEYGAPTA